jgi:hypothetical protein
MLSASAAGGPLVVQVMQDSSVSYYGVYVANPDSTQVYFEYILASEFDCVAGSCSYVIPESGSFLLASSTEYTAYVAPYGPAGFTDITTGVTQGFFGPVTATTVADAPSVVNTAEVTVVSPDSGTPTFTWQAVPDASWYQALVATPGPDYETIYLFQWFSADTLGCVADNLCTLPSGIFLPNGDFELWIQTYGPGGISQGGVENTGWVGPVNFTVNAPNPTAVDSATMSPTGPQTVTDPDFTWAPTNGEFYRVEISQGGTPFVNFWISAEDVGCADGVTTCTATLSDLQVFTGLSTGSYTWRVDTYTPAYSAAVWSDSVSFTTGTPGS